MFALQKTIGSARLAKQIVQQKRSIVATPPTGKVSFAEKIIAAVMLTASMMVIPTYIAVNIKHYRGSS